MGFIYFIGKCDSSFTLVCVEMWTIDTETSSMNKNYDFSFTFLPIFIHIFSSCMQMQLYIEVKIHKYSLDEMEINYEYLLEMNPKTKLSFSDKEEIQEF